jgi:hypothetical protein
MRLRAAWFLGRSCGLGRSAGKGPQGRSPDLDARGVKTTGGRGCPGVARILAAVDGFERQVNGAIAAQCGHSVGLAVREAQPS